MPKRLLTLVLCVLVLQPRPLCACQLVGCHAPQASDLDDAAGDTRHAGCTGHTGTGRAPARNHSVAAFTDSYAAPGCLCCCHSHPDGPSDCPHATPVAVADSSKPPTVGDLSNGPLTFLPFSAPQSARPVLLDNPSSMPGPGRVPLYLILCDLRN